MDWNEVISGKPPSELSSEESEQLEQLAADWLEAKEAEDGWKDRRKALEAQIVELAPMKRKGSKTSTYKDLGFKVKTEGRIYLKVDEDAWEAIKGELPPELQAVVELKPKVSTKGYKWIMKNKPELLNTLAKAIDSKPGSPGVSVEIIED